jgi:hypothetical protein
MVRSMKSAIFSILAIMMGMTATLALVTDPAKGSTAKVYVPEPPLEQASR